MIGGDYSEFLDHLYHGDELWIKYKGVVYFIQGWYDKKKRTLGQWNAIRLQPIR